MRLRLKNIIISLEGPNSEINDAIRGKRVFDITTKNLKHFIELKQIFKREELRVTVNMVVSKANFRYVSEMANLCVDLGVSELVLLQFIPEGNGKKNDMSLSIKDIKFLIGEVAIIYGKVKEKLDIIPKFVMPYAEKYCKVKYKKEFPKFYSMCGAGESFFFINNKGEVFPCDSYQDKIIEKNNIEDLKIDSRDLLEIIDKEGFNDIFELTEGDDIYMGVEPCKDCEYLRKQCYPCVLSLMNTGGKVVNVCKAMKEEVESECF